MKKQKVFILSENPLFAEGLASLLKRERNLEVVGAATRSLGAGRKLESLQPDVVIVEGRDVITNALNVLVRLAKVRPNARVISVNLDEKDVFTLVGFRLTATEANLLRAIKTRLLTGDEESGRLFSLAAEAPGF
jgi:DNA-binding NarL/FixJ family response regulator